MNWKHGILFSFAFLIFLFYSPTLLDIRPTTHSVPFPAFRGALEINNLLSKTEHLFDGIIRGPESIVFYDDDIFTGTEDGNIMKISGNKLIPMARIGRECQIPWEERLCGRPLGLRMGKDGMLYIVDAYYGLHRMNITTGTLTRLLPTHVTVEGKKITFPDDMDIDEKGNIYFSEASTKWDLSEIYYLMTEREDSGRVIKFNPYNGEIEVIMRNLFFPNGVQLSHDGNSLLICEINQRRVIRYYLKGPKKGQQDVFVDNLPAEPDNIRPSARGGYWVALTSARNSTHQLFYDRLAEYPSLMRLWARAQHGLGTVLMAIAQLSPSPAFMEFAYRVKRADIMLAMFPRHGIILELDAEGKILRSMHAPDGSTSDLSEVTEHNGYLYLGSFVNRYLGRLKL